MRQSFRSAGHRIRCVFAFGMFLAGCASRLATTPVEDAARLDVPIAICQSRVEAATSSEGTKSPPVEAYWSLVFPGFRSMTSPLRTGEVDCVGQTHDGRSLAGGAVFPFSPMDSVITPASRDGIEVVWLSAFRSGHLGEGALAVVRVTATELELLAVGTYGGSQQHSTFSLGRLGASTVVTAFDDGCADTPPNGECSSQMKFFLASGGELSAPAATPARALRDGSVEGFGRVQYRFSAEPPTFDKKVMRVHERLQVLDARGEEVRDTEGDRTFREGQGALVPDQASLWTQQFAKP